MIAVYTITRNRLELTQKSFALLRSRAGVPFDQFVFDNGSTDGTQEWLQNRDSIKRLHVGTENYGQNIAANILLDWIMEGEYEWIVRWDNDMVPRGRRFLKKLVKCAQAIKAAGVEPIVTPTITKLKNPVPTEYDVAGEDVGFQYQTVPIIGGACRVHHRDFFKDPDGVAWRFNPFGALGFGEAREVMWRVRGMKEDGRKAMLVRIPWLKVEHVMGEDGQAAKYPEYFNFRNKEVSRYVSYGLA